MFVFVDGGQFLNSNVNIVMTQLVHFVIIAQIHVGLSVCRARFYAVVARCNG